MEQTALALRPGEDIEVQLRKQIKVVAEVRQRASNAVAVKVAIQKEYEEDNKDMFEIIAAVLQEVKEAEDTLRELTLQAYVKTGNKAPVNGVGIRETIIYVYNNAEALKWAIEHKMALKLDETAFKKIVKATPLPFVTSKLEPQATIAAELVKE